MNELEETLVRAVDAEKALHKANERLLALTLTSVAFSEQFDQIIKGIVSGKRHKTVEAAKDALEISCELLAMIGLSLMDPTFIDLKPEERRALRTAKSPYDIPGDIRDKMDHMLQMGLEASRIQWDRNCEEWGRPTIGEDKRKRVSQFMIDLITALADDLGTTSLTREEMIKKRSQGEKVEEFSFQA